MTFLTCYGKDFWRKDPFFLLCRAESEKRAVLGKTETAFGKKKKCTFGHLFLNFILILSVSENCVRKLFSGDQEAHGGGDGFSIVEFFKGKPRMFWGPIHVWIVFPKTSKVLVKHHFSVPMGGVMDFRSLSFSKENPECFEVRFMSELFSQKQVKS